MKTERLQEIMNRLEQDPDMPVMILREDEASEAYGRLYLTHPDIRLAIVHGINYLAISDAALEVLLERLGRERQQCLDALKDYDRQIDGIRSLRGAGRRTYCNPVYTLAPHTETERRKASEELLARRESTYVR